MALVHSIPNAVTDAAEMAFMGVKMVRPPSLLTSNLTK